MKRDKRQKTINCNLKSNLRNLITSTLLFSGLIYLVFVSIVK
jgi:hypothetical protein